MALPSHDVASGSFLMEIQHSSGLRSERGCPCVEMWFAWHGYLMLTAFHLINSEQAA